ncbi:MAG TPA: DUF58 domain-containing protein [Candidatus Acidoferrum sp.]|nr:DUF58 domain-containing protein [Candidatus Acidoferrum sp.]
MTNPLPSGPAPRPGATRPGEALRRPPVIGPVPPVIQLPPPGPLSWRAPGPRARFFRQAARPALLSPEELERFGNLLVFARSMVEGYFAGKHKSPHRGSSVEFTDYKEYVPGDDPKRIDWRAYGRSRRLFVRQYEAETDMVIYLLVDVSGSMSYAAAGGESKYIVAAKVAAALAYLMIHQGDKAALVLFAATLNRSLPPGGTRRHLHSLVSELETVQPAWHTGTAAALAECNLLFKKRGRLVVLSDFWDETEKTFEALSRFLHRKFEILLLHVAHPDELDLPAVHAARFHDLETHEEVEVEVDEIREAYRETARCRADALAREANQRRISYALVRTNRPYLDAIEAYLGFRGGNIFSGR